MLKLLHRYNDKFVSKWLVLTMDIFIVAFAFVIAVAVRYNFDFRYFDPSLFKYHIALLCIIKVFFFNVFATYSGIIRHTTLNDAKQILKASLLGSGLLIGLNSVNGLFAGNYFSIPNTILFIDFFISVFGLIASRVLIKNVFDGLADSFKSRKKVIIYGAGRLGLLTKDTLLADGTSQYKILCLVDDNSQKIGKRIDGVKVLSRADAIELVKTSRLDNIEMVFAIQAISTVRKGEITEEFMELGIPLRMVPPVKQWINGQLSPAQISNISIEDLLDRPSIQINNRSVKAFVKGKRILVTGAAGSIGSEIVRQLISFEPEQVIILDQAESPLYDLESELTRLKSNLRYDMKLSVEVRSITNMAQMEKVFVRYKPEVVFHAAAYKHVPLMEANPFKAVEVNTFGTQGLADLASKHKVEKFVFISTDKAVNPTNVMGATKRLAEIYVQSLNSNHDNDTRFIVTRFGNVLGSNGSVIPLFKKQIEQGGPVTVTHKDIIRYFMTIPEACQLVLEAGTMGKGGEIFVFDMGVPVRIVDLAEKMIKLSGFDPYTQIAIEFSGLRPGEKLYEELLSDEESTIPTHHAKIMAAKVKAQNHAIIYTEFVTTRKVLNEMMPLEIVRFLKRMVPEYISNNSPFEKLDEEQEESAV